MSSGDKIKSTVKSVYIIVSNISEKLQRIRRESAQSNKYTVISKKQL